MPRKFLESDKGKWLKLYENGKSEVWIAREKAKCDPRTVKRGIDEARRKQEVRIARTELVKDALRKHQDNLLEELDNILFSLTVPEKDFMALSWYHSGDSIFTHRQATEEETVDVPKSRGVSRSRAETVRVLLKQHLKNDRMWKVLALRDKAYAAHIEARIALQLKAVVLIEKKTGFKLTAKGDAKPPFIYSYTTGSLFFKTILHKAFGNFKYTDIENDITANIDNGEVRYNDGLILAVAPGAVEKTRKNLIDALGALESSPEVRPVVDTYETLEEITARARQVVEQIKLLGLIHGQCEICQRLGM